MDIFAERKPPAPKKRKSKRAAPVRLQFKLNLLPTTVEAIGRAAEQMKVSKQTVVDLLVAYHLDSFLRQPLVGTWAGARFWQHQLEKVAKNDFEVDFDE